MNALTLNIAVVVPTRIQINDESMSLKGSQSGYAISNDVETCLSGTKLLMDERIKYPFNQIFSSMVPTATN